ncbi:MAG TPA: bifunctional diaminohydroxyphosphoribosylaminopyrimidine deaminase/5-amino-6-(5-phosphoribosylamino)uracil reductase, partial [Magnetococcales bacterium]|nr:bifunctional diaminohydroxyphosphoribosylaminopyrimidine deaminase/5-amino-6-(5-phosphoribosylamino)uracil reductase [Magnetococcales bacterium]
GELTGALMEAGLVDRLALYLAPMLIGGFDAPGLFGAKGVDRLSEALRLDGVRVVPLGADVLIDATLGEFMRNGSCLPV